MDVVFLFVAACIDRITGYQEQTPLTYIWNRYITLMRGILYEHKLLGWPKKTLADIDNIIMLLKERFLETFEKHCKHGIHTFKFHILVHVDEDLSKLGG